MTCQSCAAKDAIIQEQQQEINRLNQIIAQVKSYCTKALNEASGVLGTKGHSRGTWAYNKGKAEALGPIDEYLRE